MSDQARLLLAKQLKGAWRAWRARRARTVPAATGWRKPVAAAADAAAAAEAAFFLARGVRAARRRCRAPSPCAFRDSDANAASAATHATAPPVANARSWVSRVCAASALTLQARPGCESSPPGCGHRAPRAHAPRLEQEPCGWVLCGVGGRRQHLRVAGDHHGTARYTLVRATRSLRCSCASCRRAQFAMRVL